MKFFLTLFLLIICINKSLAANKSDKVVFLNIYNKDQDIGDAIVIRSNNQYAMIDTGLKSTFQKVKSSIKNIPEFEWVLITHNHGDHIGGLMDLLKTKKVKYIYTKDYIGTDMNCKEGYSKKDKKWEQLKDDIKALGKKKENKGYYNLRIIRKEGDKEKNTKPTLGNYKFKLFNIEQAFSSYTNYCKNNCCNENVNSIVATAVNEDGNKFYYFAGDIQEYPSDKLFDKERTNHALTHWVKEAKNYWTSLGFTINHFHVYKVSHHGLRKNKYGYNNRKSVFKSIKPDICVVTTYTTREKLEKQINQAKEEVKKEENKFTCKTVYTGNRKEHYAIFNKDL